MVLSIFLIGGCVGKVDFSKNISAEDKKLFSSYEDNVLYIKDDIRITQNGFYPNYKVSLHPVEEWDSRKSYLYKSRFYSTIVEYSALKEFNLQKFLDVVKEENLLVYRNKLLKLQSKYPNVTTTGLTLKQVDSLLVEKNSFKHIYLVDTCSKRALNLVEKEQLFLINDSPQNLKCIKNATDRVKFIAISKDKSLIKDTSMSESLQLRLIRENPKIWLSLKDTYHLGNTYPVVIEEIFKIELEKPVEKIDFIGLNSLLKYLKSPNKNFIRLALKKVIRYDIGAVLLKMIPHSSPNYIKYIYREDAYDEYVNFFINLNNEVTLEMLSIKPKLIDDVKNPTSRMLNHPKVVQLYKRREALAKWRREHPSIESSPSYSTSSTSSSTSSSTRECTYRVKTEYVPGGNGRTAQVGYNDCN